MFAARRPIPSRPGFYATYDGRIFKRSGDGLEEVKQANHTGGYKAINFPTSKKRRQRKRSTGKIYLQTVQKRILTHHLILEAFGFHPQPHQTEVRHLNGSKDDNRISNIVWGTSSENAKDRYRLGERCLKGEQHTRARFTNEQVIEIRWLIKHTTLTHLQIGQMYDVTKSAITCINRRASWNHLPEQDPSPEFIEKWTPQTR